MRHTRRGRSLRRRYGHARAHRPFEVSYDWAGVRSGRSLSLFERFADANRAAIELVRSGKTKRALVLYNEPHRRSDSTSFKIQKLAEYVLGPGGGVTSISPGGL